MILLTDCMITSISRPQTKRVGGRECFSTSRHTSPHQSRWGRAYWKVTTSDLSIGSGCLRFSGERQETCFGCRLKSPSCKSVTWSLSRPMKHYSISHNSALIKFLCVELKRLGGKGVHTSLFSFRKSREVLVKVKWLKIPCYIHH